MDSLSSHREWLDDAHTRLIIDKVRAKRDIATRALLASVEAHSVEEIRANAGYRRGLNDALKILMGGKEKDADGESE